MRGDFLEAGQLRFRYLVPKSCFETSLAYLVRIAGRHPTVVFFAGYQVAGQLATELMGADPCRGDQNEPPVVTLGAPASAQAFVISNRSLGWWAGRLACPATVIAPGP